MSFANSHPSYEIVGELTRFDERDSLFSRERLIPGSAEEQEYYAAHPELVKIDQRIRSFIERVSQTRTADSQQDAALYKCTFDPIAGLALPDIVDGTVAEGRALLEPAVMTARIKSIALRLGADDVRIGPLNPAWVYSYRGTPPFFPDYQANSPHFSGPPGHYRDMAWGDVIKISHPFAISMAFCQDSDLMSTGGTPISDFEVGRVYAKGALAATQLATYIRALGWDARAHHLRNYGVLVIPVAVDAGLGELGRCGYLIHPRLGTNLRLVCVTTSLPLLLDPPVDLGIQQFCETCTKCADNCPAGAITQSDKTVVRGVRKWKIDPVKCLQYWNHVGSACTICQVVCPWSKLSSIRHRIAAIIGKRLPGASLALLWADNLINGPEFNAAPPPTW